MRNLVHCLRRQALQHFSHQAVGGPVGLVSQHLTSCPQNLIHYDRNPTPLEGNTSITATPLSPNPFSLHIKGFRFVVVKTFTVGSELFCPFLSVLAGTSVDSELRDHRSVHHVPPG